MRTPVACLLGLLMFACGPKPAEQPAPSPQPATTAAPAEPTAGEPSSAGECSVDADCVPAACCHATTCAPVAKQPDCSGVMCTMNCQAGTMDCGGRCACEAGSCKAILGQP